MAKRGGRSGRKYVRDSIGRFATTGATARGGRLKTASGKKRATQTVKAKTGGKPAGTLKAKPRSEGQKYAKRVQAGKDLKRSQSTAREKKFFAETQKRLDAAPLAQSRAAKPAAAKRRGAVGKISEAKAGRIVARMDAQRGRKALPGRRNANFARTYERSRQFILKPSTAARKKGKPISVNESVQKAVANAAKRRKAKKKSVTANNARATGKLARPVAKGNIRRTGGRLGPKNTIKPGPKSPRTKMNRAIDNVIKKGKALKGSADKLRGVKKQADALRGRMLKEDKGRLSKALSKPSVTDKRSRDYGGRLTKGARGQDPATGGKKSSARRGDTAEANIPMKGRRGKQLDASISKAVKQVKAVETARLMKPKAQRKSERAAKAEAKRQAAAAKPKRVRSAESLRVSRAKRITKERSISLNPAGNSQKGAGRMAANAKRTQERALAFYKGKTKPAAAKPAAAKPARRKTLNTSGASFERRRALAEPKVASNRRLKAEASRPLQFSGKKAGGKADQLFRDKVAQASYNRQRTSEGVAARARRFYDGASQFYSAFSDRPRYSTIRKPAKDAGQWSSSSQSAWSNDLRKRRTGKRRRS